MKDNNAEYHLKRPCVFLGSACDGVLLPGDRLLSVNSQSVEDISHREAQEIFKNGGVSAVVEVSRLEEPLTTMRGGDEETVNQPYRTTPLILPNAKTIHDSPSAVVSGEHPPVPSLHPYRNSSLLLPEPRTINELPCGLRYQPMRGPQYNPGCSTNNSPQFIQRAATGQPVLYNSPAALYSEEAYDEAASQHPGYVQAKKPQLPSASNGSLSNPQESETFKMILEAEMGSTSSQPSISAQPFSKPKDGSRPSSQMSDVSDRSRSSNQAPVRNSTINQSATFKKVMYSVLGDTDF